jgi:hypothetical protein
LLATVESLRGHVFRHPVPVHVVTDSTAGVYFRDRLQRELPAALLHAQTVAYERLGLLPDSTDVTAMLLGLMEEQAGGYYSPEMNAFFVLADMPRPVLPIIAVHELTHALDDQYFAIDSLIAAQNHDSDREAAVGGVVEGSGTLVMQRFAVTELQSGRLSLDALQEFAQSDAARAERFQAAPAVVRRSLLAPYLLGSSFLLRGDPLRVADGVPRADLDRAFSTPPVSTEQLLHPEKYWDRARADAPRAVVLPDLTQALGADWTRLGDDALGELMLALLVGAEDPPLDTMDSQTAASWTVPAASGWGGDRWVAYARGDATAVVLVTRWDSDADATEYAAALRLPAGARTERRGETVVSACGVPPERVDAVLKACFAASAPRPPAKEKR